MNKKIVGLGLAAVATLALGACSRSNSSSSSSDSSVKAAIITDTGGVDDKSFNQSAWEGMQAWGKENKLKKDTDYTYFQSDSESDYATNLDSAVSNGYNLVFAIGYNLHDAVDEAAPQNEDTTMLLSMMLLQTTKMLKVYCLQIMKVLTLQVSQLQCNLKQKHVGFVGGVESDTITRFETGFKEGVASVDSSIKVDVQYVGSYSDSAKGKTIAATMYAGGADVIYQAAGGSGTGVFSQAKEINEKLPADSDKKVWVIGVDRDQTEEGNYTSSDKVKSNFVLTSTIKEVGQVVNNIANRQLKGDKFEGNTTKTYIRS